jgi:hypothetical protein
VDVRFYGMRDNGGASGCYEVSSLL